jgi:hypothetical protein
MGVGMLIDLRLFSRYLKPGGRIEVAESRAKLYCDDGSCPEDSYLYSWEVSTRETRNAKTKDHQD